MIMQSITRLLLPVLLIAGTSAAHPGDDDPGGRKHSIEQNRILLPNGWGITPIGSSLPLGDLPLNLAPSPDGKYLAVTNNGQSTQSIELVDVARRTISDSVTVRVAWLGLAWSPDGQTLYASGGNGNTIMEFAVRNGRLRLRDSIVIGKPWPEKISIAGIACDGTSRRLYAVTKENNSLYVVDAATRTTIHREPLDGEGYTCLLSPAADMLYISCWGCDKIILFDTHRMATTGSIVVGDNPNELVLGGDGKFLFAANANDNSVSVIDVRQRKVIETLNAALYPGAPGGSTTNGIALSGDGTTLFAANADNNCLAVFDVTTPGASRSRGFIPTGWYPTCVRVLGNTLYVANGKGFTSFANPDGPNPMVRGKHTQYIAGLLKGTLSIIPLPDPEELAVYSGVVYGNTPHARTRETTSVRQKENPIPARPGDTSPVRHVFYIIKENRTYDQVLGDMAEGNGDTSLVLFGENITPNQHALAREFVLLDNFYVDGEVSADGHNWSTGAYATDYLEKTWPTSYGGRGGSYDAEGHRAVANNKNGFIWDFCKRYGISYRTYGEFADAYAPNIPALEGHFCPYYTSWDQTVMDTTRFHQWQHEFDSLLACNAVPRLNTLRFINDHTEGLKKGRPTPLAGVADNDLAVGLFVDHLSHSPLWKESVVFIVEDDAQNGPDHVDAHRSTAYIAGGHVRRHLVDHTMYSTSGLLRTIELILGLPPMSQYDAAAEPLWRCFTDSADATPFLFHPPRVDLFEKNMAANEWQRRSEEFDFAREDRAPDAALNEVLWVAIKGGDRPCPAPRRAAFVKTTQVVDDDDGW